MSQVDYLEILRLRSLRYSKNSISASVHSSHHTVEDVLDAADAKSMGKTWYEEHNDEILIPAELDGVHPKAAIGLRNRWMVDRSDIVITALHRDFGGAAEAVRYAERIGKEVVRVSDV